MSLSKLSFNPYDEEEEIAPLKKRSRQEVPASFLPDKDQASICRVYTISPRVTIELFTIAGALLFRIVRKNGDDVIAKVVIPSFRMKRLEEFLDLLLEAIQHSKNVNVHIGHDYNMSFNADKQLIDIRRYQQFRRYGNWYPTKDGITLNIEQFHTLPGLISQVHDDVPAYRDVLSCMATHGDGNQEAVLNCVECCKGYDNLHNNSYDTVN